MAELPGDFAQQIRSLREAQGLSLRGLAKLIGVSSVTVWKWESGGSKPRGRMLAPLAKALDVSASQWKSPAKSGENADEIGGARGAHVEVRPLPAGTGQGQDVSELGSMAEPLADVIARAKQMIADASGTGSGNITILIEY